VPALAPDVFSGTAPALRGGASFGGGDPVRCRLVFASSGRTVDGHARSSLLDQAERAGLQPAHGCRMGICHTCKCKKLSGVVRNQLTGAISSEPGEEIQLCISTPQSDVTLDL
jgi:stearoyl-CoA 9-desaturase NADPH oxidoreductase